MRKINRIKIFVNGNNKELVQISKELEKELHKYSFTIVNNRPDLCISIGGDGSFLRMVRESHFNSNVLYIGVNAGTLGFLQEINIKDTKDFVKRINDESYKIENINIQETIVNSNNKKQYYYSLNEIVIRHKDLKKIRLPLYIDNEFLECFTGDGILISTSTGSTAYNMSNGGAIVYNTLNTLSITPIAPINNKVYNTLRNSLIIPADKKVLFKSLDDYKDLLMCIDGENKIFNNVESIETYVSNKTITCLRMNDFHFIKGINNKILNNDKL